MDVFTALADPTRRKILELLASQGQLSATDIYTQFDVSHPAISQHLKILRQANLVRMDKRAQQRIYQLNRQSMAELQDWASQLEHMWNRRLDALDSLLKAAKNNVMEKP